MGKIHAPRHIRPGGRMDRFLTFLRGRGEQGATTLEIVQHARVVAVSAIAAEARAMGFSVDCREEPRSPDGAKLFRYRLGGIWSWGSGNRESVGTQEADQGGAREGERFCGRSPVVAPSCPPESENESEGDGRS
jgi:hypothetical protein